jgi:D-3-phosphoglycerate dehydrogenase / 2-oxoglutarate reductase
MVDTPLKVVISDCDHGSIEEEKGEFARIGAKLKFVQAKSEEDLIRECREADGVLNQYSLMTRRVLEHLPECKVIARYGIGVDSVDLRAATELGIIVANVPDYCVEEVADQTLALLLTLVRKTAFFDTQVKRGRWECRQGAPIHRLSGRTMGLVGYGKIGRAVAKRVSAFGVRVISFDPYIHKTEEGIPLTDLETLLAESDFISIHCPLNESTRHLIGERELRKAAKKPLLINTSRGPIVDEKALIRALEEGLLTGAGLDVLEKEPPDRENPLLRMENVILTPHTSFYSEESFHELKRRTARAVSDVLRGKWPESLVNRDVVGKTRAVIGE